MRKHIAAIIASAVVLSTLAGRGQVEAIDLNRPHNEDDYEQEHDHTPSSRLRRAGEHEQEKDAMQKYTCVMHPEVITDHPGNCPKCGMKLVPMEEKKRRTSNAQRSTSKVGAIDHNRPRH